MKIVTTTGKALAIADVRLNDADDAPENEVVVEVRWETDEGSRRTDGGRTTAAGDERTRLGEQVDEWRGRHEEALCQRDDWKRRYERLRTEHNEWRKLADQRFDVIKDLRSKLATTQEPSGIAYERDEWKKRHDEAVRERDEQAAAAAELLERAQRAETACEKAGIDPETEEPKVGMMKRCMLHHARHAALCLLALRTRRQTDDDRETSARRS